MKKKNKQFIRDRHSNPKIWGRLRQEDGKLKVILNDVERLCLRKGG